MKLELNTDNLQIEFECSDDENHLDTLTILHHLIDHLNTHKDVKLNIVSLVDDPDADPDLEPEYEDADPQ